MAVELHLKTRQWLSRGKLAADGVLVDRHVGAIDVGEVNRWPRRIELCGDVMLERFAIGLEGRD